MKKLFESFLSLMALLFLITLCNIFPAKAAGPAIAGHYLKTGEVLVGVTGSAPVANKLTGTANQITVTTAAEGGNLTFSLPSSVTVDNINVTGTASWLSTGTYTAQDLVATYGVSAATGVFSGAVTGASFAATGALTGATVATTGAGTIVGDFKAGAANYVSTMTASNGNWAITGNVVSLAAVQGATVTGTTSVTSPIVSITSVLNMTALTAAQIVALDPSDTQVGIVPCSDCATVGVCISTGTAVADWALITDKSAACE